MESYLKRSMKIQTEKYLDARSRWPESGQHILAQQQDNYIVVYQAYNNQIADYAIKHQLFGGTDYSYNRMSWIKPNFLWMMYRCGWASKENQERVVAIWINKSDFENILPQAVFSSFNAAHYLNHEQWKEEMGLKDVRLQWDPDHDPAGNKLTRRAIQLGMKGTTLANFGKQQIVAIEDITDFVKQQSLYVINNELDKLIVPVETIFKPADENLCRKIGISD